MLANTTNIFIYLFFKNRGNGQGEDCQNVVRNVKKRSEYFTEILCIVRGKNRFYFFILLFAIFFQFIFSAVSECSQYTGTQRFCINLAADDNDAIIITVLQ